MTGSLHHILNLGSEALQNSKSGVDVTGHNISNAQTPGYSRQILNLETRLPTQRGIHVFGNGAMVESVRRVHDQFLETQIRNETQEKGHSDGLTGGLARLEAIFNPELTSTVRDRMTSFGNSLRDMANYPEEAAVRTNVMESGVALCQSFQSAHTGVATIQSDINAELVGHLNTVNRILEEIGSLNQGITELEIGGRADANDLQDRRDEQIRRLSELIDAKVYKDEHGTLTVRGPADSLLVEGNRCGHFSLQDKGTSKMPRVIYHNVGQSEAVGMDVTDRMERGRLSGLLEVRDVYGQKIRDNLNEMAQTFATQFNALHGKGYGLGQYSRTNGRPFFSGLDTGSGEPARDIHVDLLIVNDIQAISPAMTQNTPGDNIVANELVHLSYTPLFDGGKSTVAQFYDAFVGGLGIQSRRSKEMAQASEIVMAQLASQRESVAGVSLDEEAQNLLKYQHMFTASSRVITTADELFKTVLDLKR